MFQIIVSNCFSECLIVTPTLQLSRSSVRRCPNFQTVLFSRYFDLLESQTTWKKLVGLQQVIFLVKILLKKILKISKIWIIEISGKNNIFCSKMILNVFWPVIMPWLLCTVQILAKKGQKSVIFQWFYKIARNMV